MKKEVLFFVSLFLLYRPATCQNFFTAEESGFEFSVSPDLNQGANNPCEFCRPQTGRWRASHNSPQLWASGWGPSAYEGSKTAFLQGGTPNSPTYSEGIFMPFSFQSNRYYTLSLFVWSGSHINIKLANNLAHNANGEGNQSGNISFPSTSDTQTILQNHIVTGTGWQLIQIKNLKPTSNFTQLWIHSSPVANTDAFIDGCMLFQSCCIPFMEYQDTIDPPSTMVAQYILAGDSVIPSKPVGAVSFTQPWKTVWQAGELNSSGMVQGRVTMKKGFKSGQNFVARVQDCFSSPLDAFLSDSVSPIPNEQGLCLVQLRANICFGSGRYTITGTNLTTGANLTKGNWLWGKFVFVVYPTEPTEYEITITDNITGETVTRRITVGKCGCIPPKDVRGVNKVNTICGPSTSPDCFTIGKELPLNTPFQWVTEPPNSGGMIYMKDPRSSVTHVCFPPSLSGTGQFTYKLISASPGCDSVVSEFHVFYKRVPDNNCYFNNSFWGPTDLNDSNKLELHFALSLDVEEVYIELYEGGNPVPAYNFSLVRGINFGATATFHAWKYIFGPGVMDNFPYTVVMKYKCRCSSIVTIGRVINLTF